VVWRRNADCLKGVLVESLGLRRHGKGFILQVTITRAFISQIDADQESLHEGDSGSVNDYFSEAKCCIVFNHIVSSLEWWDA